MKSENLPLPKHIVEKIIRAEDGFFYFRDHRLLYSANDLRKIADSLNLINKPFQDRIDSFLTKHENHS